MECDAWQGQTRRHEAQTLVHCGCNAGCLQPGLSWLAAPPGVLSTSALGRCTTICLSLLLPLPLVVVQRLKEAAEAQVGARDHYAHKTAAQRQQRQCTAWAHVNPHGGCAALSVATPAALVHSCRTRWSNPRPSWWRWCRQACRREPGMPGRSSCACWVHPSGGLPNASPTSTPIS